MRRGKHDVQADAQWSPWTLLDGLGPLLRIGTGQPDDEVCDTLMHLEQLGLMQFAYDDKGRLLYRARTDDEARAIALLDDHMQAHRN
jgi:hypothetical protein